MLSVTASQASQLTVDARLFVLAIVLSFQVVSSAYAQQPLDRELPNCPIMPENQATQEFYADYEGKRYFFCCDGCVQDFQSDPSRFVSLESVIGFPIKALQNTAGEGSLGSELNDELPHYRESDGLDALIDRYFRCWNWMARKVERHHLSTPQVFWHLVVLLCVIPFPAFHWWKRRSINNRDAAEGRSDSSWKALAVWSLVLIAALDAFYLAHFAADNMVAREQALQESQDLSTKLKRFDDRDVLEEVHYATFITNGFPPRPRRTDHPKMLSAVYYRGNDERLESMFNGGQYLTVTFQIQLESEDGVPLDYGQSLKGITPYLRVSFLRANDTSSGYYSSEYMKRMYLTMQADRFLGRDKPVKDRVQWVETQEGVKWEARYQLLSGDHYAAEWKSQSELELDDSDYRGVVYLCEDRLHDGKIAGGRYHFAVEYCLDVEDEKVGESSDLFMGATFRGRNFAKYQITDDQWLSMTPIPEKP